MAQYSSTYSTVGRQILPGSAAKDLRRGDKFYSSLFCLQCVLEY